MRSDSEPASSVLPNLLAGMTTGLVTVVYTISFAALIFSGTLTSYFPQGVGVALVGATITAIVVAWRSPFPFTLAGPEANSAIILALAAASIAGVLENSSPSTRLFPTVWAAISLSTAITGLFLYLLGKFQLGRLARYIPYPVIGGFLAGTGWLITRSSFKVITGIPLSITALQNVFRGDHRAECLSGILMAVVLFIVLNRFKHFFTLPGLLLGGCVFGNFVWNIIKRSPLPWKHDDWFFTPFSRNSIWQAWHISTVQQIDWTVLLHQSGVLFAILTIVMLSILLNSTGLELTTARNVDLDQELRANGIANLVSGLCGGMIGYLSINRTLLNQQAGARSPLAATIAGAFCAAVLVLGSSFLAYVPKPVLGGLLLYIGVNLLIRWVVKAWSQFSRIDHSLIVLILTTIATFGFLQGVGAGILISCLLFIVSYGRTSSIKHTLSGRHYQSNVYRSPTLQRILTHEGDCIAIHVLHGFIFFGTANDLVERLRQRVNSTEHRKLLYAIFDFRLVTGLDCSAVLSFMKLRQLAAKSNLHLVFTQLTPSIQNQLRHSTLSSPGIPAIQCFPDLDRGVEWCENQILSAAQTSPSETTELNSQLQSLFGETHFVSEISRYFRSVQIPGGTPVFKQGDLPDGLYFLESGRVSVVVDLANGRSLRRRTYTDGAILGEMGFYSQEPRSASVIADQPSTLQYLSDQAFQRMESEAPHLASRFNRGVVKLVAERLRRSEEEVRTLLQ